MCYLEGARGKPLPKPMGALFSDFPLLQNREVFYLDSAATAQKPARVIEAMNHYQSSAYGPVPSGLYDLAGESQGQLHEARTRIASLVSAEVDKTIFSSNATEAINLACWGWARQNLRPGDAIALSPAEHHSNLVPWQQLASRHGMSLRYLKLRLDGTLDMQYAEEVMQEPAVKLLAVAHASNVLGVINPVRELTTVAHANGVSVLVDGTQAVPQMPVAVGEIGCEFYAWSGHKAYGPTGIGVLHTSLPLTDIEPTVQGGHMIASVALKETVFARDHWRLEPGSPRLTEAIGLGEACQLLEELGMDKVQEHAEQLVDYARPRLLEVGAQIYGPEQGRVGLLAFNLPGIHAHDVAEICARSGVCVRAGHHCAQPLHNEILGVPASVRASFAIHNQESDIDALVAALREAKEIFA